MKGSLGPVALKMLMLCIYNFLSKFSDEKHLNILGYGQRHLKY